MSIDAAHFEKDRNTRGNFWRWTGILLPPIAWAIQLQAVYLTSEKACGDLNFTWNHLISAIAVASAIIGGAIAWGYWPAGDYEATKEKGKPEVRKRFMGILGVALSIFFAVVIFAQWLPTIVGVPCGK
jgi:hypothetical protein